MATTIELKYGTSGQTFTCLLAGIASAAVRQSTSVDNTTNLFLDALVVLKVKTGAGTIADLKQVNVYAYGSVDGGTTYPDAVTGTDGTITLNSPTQLRVVGVVSTPAAATTYVGGPFSVAAAFGGVLPAQWGIVVENRSGIALDATEGNHAKLWQGVQASSV